MTSGIYLAFDFGTQRIGVAVGDAITRSARELNAVPQDWKKIEGILADWRPSDCVVGLPLGADGEEQAITALARGFAENLKKHFAGPVHLCDERYSSKSALGELREARADGTMTRRIKKGDKDSTSARLILEQWLAENRESRIGNRESEKTT